MIEGIQQQIKSILDRCVSILLLILTFPIGLIIAVLIYQFMGGPAIFTQNRAGKEGKIFSFYKFRTMTNACDPEGRLLPDEQRLTTLGLFLRKSSLDELPQLFNILKGEMSFVGPRPLLVRYLNRYTSEQFRRHEVNPGITGLAQISGRNAISWEEKFKLDVWYIDHWSLWLDLKILFLTVRKVIQRDGINQEGFTTSEEFKGIAQSQEDS
jgi:lipopolysaccharide/colanic/teichoic acid biosynthesis glycosyltransferase